jgi:hypothetical protein
MKRTKIGAPQRRLVMALGLALILLGFAAPGAIAQKNYAPGVTDTEIKLGQTGPASPYSAVGKAETAYFEMINEQGGVNGRKINLISSTMPILHRKRLSRPVGSSRKTRLRLFGKPWARPPTRQSKDIWFFAIWSG